MNFRGPRGAASSALMTAASGAGEEQLTTGAKAGRRPAAGLPGFGRCRGKLLGDACPREEIAMAQAMARATVETAMLSAEAPAIDRAHLKQMTFGDRSLECELLQLFDRQAEVLMARMRQSDSAVLAMLAHTLK